MTLDMPSPGPPSPLFDLLDTPNSGRGTFANQLIPSGTHLLTSSDLVYSIVFREYRREVCNWCFHYEQGDILPIRENPAALVWCTQQCKQEWSALHGDFGIDAYACVEDLARKQAKNNKTSIPLEENTKDTLTAEQVELAWDDAENVADSIRRTRNVEKLSKGQRRLIQDTLTAPVDSMMINHSLSGILAAKHQPEHWQAVEQLYAAPQPYTGLAQMKAHILSYHQLLVILPVDLLETCNRAILMTIINRDAHNSFGIRSLDDDACEMFGYATWPSGAYWNHSCSPNISKRREGRSWIFTTSRDVEAGEELCITYLGGEERTQKVEERRADLWKAWKFMCACAKCEQDLEDEKGSATVAVES